MSSFFALVIKNWSGTPRTVTAVFAVIHLLLSAVLVSGLVDEYRGRIYIRDHGVSTYGVVTNKYSEYGRGTHFYLNYKYTPRQVAGVPAKSVLSDRHEISVENYRKYEVGSRIAVKYDRNDPNNTHLDVQGYWSDNRLMLSGVLQFIIFDVQLAMPVFAFWLFAGWISRAFFAPPAPASPSDSSHLSS